MTASRYKKYTSFFFDSYQQAKLRVNEMAESDVIKHAKESLNAGFIECKLNSSAQLEQAKSHLVEMVKSNPARHLRESIAGTYEQYKSVCYNDYQQVKSDMADTLGFNSAEAMQIAIDTQFEKYKSQYSRGYQQAKSCFNEVMESETAMRTKAVLEGAINAASAVHWIFDLGLFIIPATSSFYTVFKGAKYTITIVSLATSCYMAYADSKVYKTLPEKLNHLENEINKASKASISAEQIFEKDEELLRAAGYASQLNGGSVSIEMHDSKANSNVLSSTSSYAEWENSKALLWIKALLDGSVKSALVFNIFEVAATILPKTQAYILTRNLFMGATLISSTLSAYNYRETNVYAEHQLNELEKTIIPTYNTLLVIEKNLGTKETLKDIAKFAEKITKQPVQLGVADYPLKKEKTTLLQLAESKPAAYLKAIIDGAVKASGVHIFLGMVLPNSSAIKYIASDAVLVLITYRSHVAQQSIQVLQKKIINLEEKIQEIQDLLTIAKKIIMQQQEYVLQLLNDNEIEQQDQGTPMNYIIIEEMPENDEIIEKIAQSPNKFSFFSGSENASSQPRMREFIQHFTPINRLY